MAKQIRRELPRARSDINANSIKPIETHYKGYRFRSRLEARWAVFFDVMEIEWDYEHEGYDLGPLGYYLPDFYLSNVGLRSANPPYKGMIVEIKPGYDESAGKKLATLCEIVGKDGVLLADPKVSNDWSGEKYEVAPDWDNAMVFMKCEDCGAIKVEYSESNYTGCDVCCGHADNETETIQKAINTARGARFEHGECGC